MKQQVNVNKSLDMDLKMKIVSPLLQWTVSGPAGPSGVRAQPAVVQGDRPPPEPPCSPSSMEGPHVRALTTAPQSAWPLTVVSSDTPCSWSKQENITPAGLPLNVSHNVCGQG